MKKKSLIKGMAILLSATLCFSSMVGCQSAEEKQAQETAQKKEVASTKEVNQNDYRGGYMRVKAITNKVIEVVNNFNASQNKDIIKQNPSNYWNDANFQYFANDFLVSKEFDYTQYCNELESPDFDEVVTYTKGLFYDKEQGIYIDGSMSNFNMKKNAVNDYSITYNQNKNPNYLKSEIAYTFRYSVDSTFDPNHDWLQMQHVGNCPQALKTPVVEHLVEYGRQKDTNSFVIQFPTERLYITYETLEGSDENEFNPLENAKITYFAYSKLSGKKLPYYVEREIEQIEAGILTPEAVSEGIDEEGNIVFQYNLRDSIFPHFNDITADWVLEYPIEEGYYDNYIVFDGKDMTIYNQNHMSNQMEIIEFHSDGTIQDKTLSLVETLTPFTLSWVNEDGSKTGTCEGYVNENRDFTDENGDILIPAEKALYNSEGKVIVGDDFLAKIGELDETPVEDGSEEGLEEEPEEKSEEKSDKK